MASSTVLTEQSTEQLPDTSAFSPCRLALQGLKPQLDALESGSLLAISTDIPFAFRIADAAYAKVLALRPLLVRGLAAFDVALLDNLPVYARAMLCAHTDYQAALDVPSPMPDLIKSAIARRSILLSDCKTLIAHGLLSEQSLDGLRGINGHANVMFDLAFLARLLRSNARKIAKRTSVKPSELRAAEDLARRFREVRGSRNDMAAHVADANRTRQAAYTLFIYAYTEVRAAVQYLRRQQGDADAFVPTVFLTGRRKSDGKAAELPARQP